MTQPLLIVGNGGLAREVLDAVTIDPTSPYVPVGIVDDDPKTWGRLVHGVPVIGGLDEVAAADHDTAVLLCIGSARSPGSRAAVAARLDLEADRYATIVHARASIGPSSSVGPGSIVLAGVVLTADVTLGAHVIVMPATVLTHDDVLAPFATVASGVRLAGACEVAERAYLGAGCLVREGVRIGAEAVIGQGAVVLRDVPDGETWVGNPARRLER